MFAGKCAIVVGGAKGIGAAVSSVLASSGARVALTSRDVTTAQEFAAALPHDAVGVACDVRETASIDEAVGGCVRDSFGGRLDVMVYCSGITLDKLLLKTTPVDALDVLQVNLLGAIHACGLASKAMLRGRKGGSIVTIGSVVGSQGSAGQSVYAASKSGLAGFTSSLAQEVGPRGVRVNVVEPGFIDTAMTASLPEDRTNAVVSATPLRRLGTPEDVAAAVAFLASDAASFITGAVLPVHGGLRIP